MRDAIKQLSLSMSMAEMPRKRPPRARLSLIRRLREWLSSKSRERLARGERTLLARFTAATGTVMLLEGRRGPHAGRMARLATTKDASLDAVVSIAALADADDVASLLGEIKRVLRPGGRLIFVEPVAARAGTRLRRVQRMFDFVWRLLAGSPRAPRDLWNDLKTARFGGLTYEHVSLSGLGRLPVPHVAGEAVRTEQGDVHPSPPSPTGRQSKDNDPGTTQPAFAFFG